MGSVVCVYRRGKGEGGSGDDDGYADTAKYMQTYTSAVAQFVQPIKLRQVFLHGQSVNQSCPPQTGQCMYRFTHIRTYVQHKVYIGELIADCGNQEFVPHDPSLAGLPPFS